MKTIAVVCCLSFASIAWGAATADDARPAGIVITGPWLRANPKGSPVIGGYVTITNDGAASDKLLRADIPMAARGEIHSMTMTAGIMHMQRLATGLEIAPKATVTLSPGGYHLMFVKPTAQVREGDHVEGSLTFAKAGTIRVTFDVAGFGAKTAPGQDVK